MIDCFAGGIGMSLSRISSSRSNDTVFSVSKFFPHLQSVDRDKGESAIARYRKERNARITATGSNSSSDSG